MAHWQWGNSMILENEVFVKPENIGNFFDALKTNKNNASEKKAVEAKRYVNSHLGHFVMRPHRKVTAGLQAFKKLQAFNGGVVKGDLPQMLQDQVMVTMPSDTDVDMFWNVLFNEVPTTPTLDYFEITDVTKGMAFKKMEEGEKVSIYGLGGSAAKVGIDKYGSALGFSEETVRYRKIFKVVDKAKEFRHTYYQSKTDQFANLINAAAVQNVSDGFLQAWVTTYTNTNDSDKQTLIRDIDTLNDAGYKMAVKLKKKPYGNMANASFFLTLDPKMKTRINRAISYLNQPVSGTRKMLEYNIVPIYTFNENVTTADTKGRLVLPGRKLMWGQQGELDNYNYADVLTLTYAMAYYSWYGAGIGDTDQVMEIQFG
jgi:hypothetical protein